MVEKWQSWGRGGVGGGMGGLVQIGDRLGQVRLRKERRKKLSQISIPRIQFFLITPTSAFHFYKFEKKRKSIIFKKCNNNLNTAAKNMLIYSNQTLMNLAREFLFSGGFVKERDRERERWLYRWRNLIKGTKMEIMMI